MFRDVKQGHSSHGRWCLNTIPPLMSCRCGVALDIGAGLGAMLEHVRDVHHGGSLESMGKHLIADRKVLLSSVRTRWYVRCGMNRRHRMCRAGILHER